jgi:signal transduction histidine kinase
MNIFVAALLYIVAFINTFVALMVFSRGAKDRINLIFGLMSAGVALWCVAIANFYYKSTYLQFVNWTRVTHFAALFIALMFMYFTFFFPKRPTREKRYFTLLPAGIFLLLCYLIFSTDLFIQQIYDVSYELGPLYFLYSFVLLITFSIGFFVLILKYLKEQSLLTKGQIKYVVAGGFATSLLGTIFDLILPILGNFSYLWLGPVATVFLVSAIYLAVLRYKLFDIKLIAVETISFAIVITILVRTLLSDGIDLLFNFGLLIIVSIFSVFLVRGVIKDMKEREHIEQLSNDLFVANEQLRQMDRQKSDFVSIASHQLRTPLTAIKGYASLLLENSFGEIPDQVRGAVGKIFESSQRMVMIVENFLTVSRIERGKMFYKFEVLDLQKITKDMVNDMRPVADGYGLEIRFREDTTKEHLVRADIMKLKQIVHNLLDESVRHTPKGFVEVSLSFSQHADRILLSISDTGEGATPVKIKQMFERYEPDVHEGEIRKETGVELYIAREIVKAHRGKLWAESEGLGRGLTFFVELPALKANVE